MEKTEWPSKARLKELRDQGIFPYSGFAVRATASAMLIAGLFLMSDTFLRLVAVLAKMQAEPVANIVAVKAKIPVLLDLLQNILLASSMVVLAFYLVAVLMQSRFFFSFINLSFDLSQVLPFRNSTAKSLMIALLKSFGGLTASVAFGLVSCWLVFQSIWTATLTLPVSASQLSNARQALLTLLMFWCLSLVVMGLLAYIITRTVFMLKHRMSKQEAELD